MRNKWEIIEKQIRNTCEASEKSRNSWEIDSKWETSEWEIREISKK